MNQDFEGIFKFKFFVPFFYIVSWALAIFGSIFFPEVYQTMCIAILIYSLLKTAGLIVGGVYAVCKLNNILSFQEEDKKESGEVIEVNPNYHGVVIPNYKEQVQLLQETLSILAVHKKAKTDYLIFLAMESHEDGAEQKAKNIIERNKQKFKFMGYTLHKVREGQAKGKASNVSWCVENMMDQLTSLQIQQNQILLTILDADSWAPEQYFLTIDRTLKEKPETMHKSIFCPPQIYTRNNLEVPVINRVYDIMHSFVHLSNLAAIWYAFPLSNYSLSYSLVKQMGFWDTCADAIGEDFHTCQKACWKNQGQIITVPILTPFNQLSLTGGEGYCQDMKARFWQAERHTRGVTDAAYCLNMLFKTSFACKNFILTVLVLEVYLLAAVIPWSMLALGIHYKLVNDEENHYYSMLMIDILLNLTPVFTLGSYIPYEIFKRKANKKLFKQQNEPLWRVIQYPIFFIFALFGYSVPAFIISSFGVLCTQTEYRVAEKVITKPQKQNQEEGNPNKQEEEKEVKSPQQLKKITSATQVDDMCPSGRALKKTDAQM